MDLAFFRGSPFGITMHVLKPVKTIAAITAHNMELSMEEFEGQNGQGFFPFDDLSDPFLWDAYSQHIQHADVVLCPSNLTAESIQGTSVEE